MNTNEARVIIEMAISEPKGDEYYQNAVGVAEWTQRMVTGQGHGEDGIVQKDWLKEVRPKETETELIDRKHVYRSATKTACRPIMVFYSKAYRVDGIRDDISHSRKEEVREAVRSFYEGRDLFTYLRTTHVQQEFSDPNSYLIVLKQEQINDAGLVDGISTYPVIVPSVEIPYQKTVNGKPNWIVRHQTFKTKDSKAYSVFTLYAAGLVVVYRELVEGLPPKSDEVPSVTATVGTKRYEATYYVNTGTTEFPGIQWGAFKALGKEYRVSALDPASDLLDELIPAKSIYDVAKDKHVRPHRYEFTTKCEHQVDGIQCDEGSITYYDDDKQKDISNVCPGCNGKGVPPRKTENNVTRILMPDYNDPSEIMDLSKLYHYEDINLKTVIELKEVKDSLVASVPYAVFSSQAEATPLITRTATENLLEAENINNRVMPFAERGSRIFETVIRLTAQYMGIYDLEVTHSFPENLKLESLTNLIERLGKAKANGAPQESIFAIQCEITAKTNASNPVTIANLKAFEVHRPFRSMTDGERMAIIADRSPQDPDRRAYENWDRIKTDLLNQHENFYAFEYDRQAKLIEDKAEELANRVVYNQVEEPELKFSNELA